MKMLKCTLCCSDNIREINLEKDVRKYFHCGACDLVFVDSDFHLTPQAEKSRYEYHQNGIHQPGYVGFLNKSIEPTLPFLHEDMVGLDYGCGPAPTLSVLLANNGIICYNYDPHFHPYHPLECYDFIFATECIEHFYTPLHDFEKIYALLKPEGILTIMTEIWESPAMFKTWYYKNDPTHVSFFHINTFKYLARIFNLKIVFGYKNRVIIFKRGNP